MNFGGHVVGGVVAGVVAAGVAGAAAGAGTPPAMFDELEGLLGSGALAAGCFGMAFLMALFPDLDTASIPQRWYVRIMFVGLVTTLIAGWRELFAVLALLALLPLLHRHRGWTHWPITPWLVALLLAVAQEYADARASWFSRFSWQDVGSLLLEGWPFVLACVLGHYTHLVLDSRSVRWLPFVRNGAGHH